jgi:amidase
MEEGIPVGAQLIGGRYKEDVLLQAAAEIEARSPKIQIATPAA